MKNKELVIRKFYKGVVFESSNHGLALLVEAEIGYLSKSAISRVDPDLNKKIRIGDQVDIFVNNFNNDRVSLCITDVELTIKESQRYWKKI